MIAIISDIHSNYPALRAVLDRIDALGCTRIVSLGDVTGYYAEPHRCLQELIDRKATQLLGNHDRYLAADAQSRSTTINELLVHQRRVITKAQLAFLRTLESQIDEGEFSFVHGSWVHPLDEYLYEISIHRLKANAKYFFSGHTHVQTLADFGAKIYCNPGSVGQPRDGDPRASFAVFESGQLRLERIAYPIDETIEAMKSAGFTEPRLWECLRYGTRIDGRIDRVTQIHPS